MGRVLAIAAALLLVAATRVGSASAAEPHWPPSLVIGTASPGGTYHVYGEALARLLTRELNLPVSARSTEGPTENIRLLEAGEIQIAFVTQGVAAQAWTGTGAWTEGRPRRAMQAMFPMYDTPFQFAVRTEANARTVPELAGKRIGIGPGGGTAGTYVPAMFKALKIEAPFVTGSWAELTGELVAGRIDALAVAAGVPFPSFADLERQAKVRYLPLSPREIVDLRLAMPELGASSVPAGSYPSLRRIYPTVGLYNFAVSHPNLPDDLVYEIVDTVFGNREALVEASPAAAETSPSNIGRNSFMPYHPGAARWYHGKGGPDVIRGD